MTLTTTAPLGATSSNESPVQRDSKVIRYFEASLAPKPSSYFTNELNFILAFLLFNSRKWLYNVSVFYLPYTKCFVHFYKPHMQPTVINLRI